MSRQNKAELNDNFTEDIDATIDNLFAPVKEIEIDPLTNEIREKKSGQAQPNRTTEEENSSASPDLILAGDNKREQSDEDNFLSLDMELDLDIEEPEADAVEIVPESADDSGGHGIILEKLSQTIMSLEWEIKEETINTALRQAQKLKKTSQAGAVPEVDRVLSLMIVLLKGMKEKSDIKPRIPTALTRATDALRESLSPHGDTGPASAVAEELKDIAAENGGTEHDNTSPDSPRQQDDSTIHASVPGSEEAQDESEPEDILLLDSGDDKDREPEHAPDMEAPTENPNPDIEASRARSPQEEPYGDTDIETPVIISEKNRPDVAGAEMASASDQTLEEEYDTLQKVMVAHLAELERLNARIIPVEKLLSRTPGMEKLYAFQKDVRGVINRQKDIIESTFGKKSGVSQQSPDTAAPAMTSVPVHPPETSSNDATCPWQELTVMDFNGCKIAFPLREIAFAGNLPRRFRKKLYKESEFSLAWLKSWPWVKIGPLLTGPTGEKDEKTLKGMKLPVINSEISETVGVQDESGSIKNPVAVILRNETGRAGVIYVENSPDSLKITRGHVWMQSPVQEGIVAGKLEIDGNTLVVMTLSGYNQ